MITKETNWGQFVRNGSCLIFLSRQLLTDCILGESEKKKKKAALPNPPHRNTLAYSTICWDQMCSQPMHKKTVETADLSAYICTCQQFRGEHTYSPQCTIHWVAIFVHTSRASLLTILFGKFCICVQIQVHILYIYSIPFFLTYTDTLHFTKTMFSLQVFLAEDKWQYYGILEWGDGRLKGLLKDICLIALSNLDLVPLFFGTREKTGDPT